jgi:hypothetical protein
MASFADVMKRIGRGARAVGRGTMKGLLGFDDRDFRRPRTAPVEDVEEELNPEYSGVNRGKFNMLPTDVESDGLIQDPSQEPPPDMPLVESDGLIDEPEVKKAGMEPPPDLGAGVEEALIGLEMPRLGGPPKIPGKRGGKVSPSVPNFRKSPAEGQSPLAKFEEVEKVNVAPGVPGLTGPGATRAAMGGSKRQVPGWDGMLPGISGPDVLGAMEARSGRNERVMGSGGEAGPSYGPEEMDAAAAASTSAAGTLASMLPLGKLAQGAASKVGSALDLKKAQQFLKGGEKMASQGLAGKGGQKLLEGTASQVPARGSGMSVEYVPQLPGSAARRLTGSGAENFSQVPMVRARGRANPIPPSSEALVTPSPLPSLTGYTKPVGARVASGQPPTPPLLRPGKADLDKRMSAFEKTYRPKGEGDFMAPGGPPMPGQPGMEGPMLPSPGVTSMGKGGREFVRWPDGRHGRRIYANMDEYLAEGMLP